MYMYIWSHVRVAESLVRVGEDGQRNEHIRVRELRGVGKVETWLDWWTDRWIYHCFLRPSRAGLRASKRGERDRQIGGKVAT